MRDRSHTANRLAAVAIALGVVLGILLMHALDVRAVAAGHGLAGSPAAVEEAVAAAVDGASDGAGVPARLVGAPVASDVQSMACACLAVVAAAVLLLLVRIVGRRRRDAAGGPAADGGVRARLRSTRWGRLRPAWPRVALCVSLC